MSLEFSMDLSQLLIALYRLIPSDIFDRIFKNHTISAKANQIMCVSEPSESNKERRSIAKHLYPELEHPATSYLKKLGFKSKVNFVIVFKLNNEIIGHMIAYPIKQKCVNKFLTREYESGNDFNYNDIASDWKNAAGYYIAYLISYQEKNRKLILIKSQLYLLKFIESNLKKNVYVFAKATKRTRRILAKLQFIKLDQYSSEPNVIHYTDRVTMLRRINKK